MPGPILKVKSRALLLRDLQDRIAARADGSVRLAAAVGLPDNGPRMELERGESFSILRFAGFAPTYAHAFVVRGNRNEPLFRPAPIPREEICRAADLPEAILHLPRQVHGAAIVEVPRADPASPGPEPPAAPAPDADGLFTRLPGHAVGVATADCLPILLGSVDGTCAAVHAGWRGLLAGVLERALEALGGSPSGPGDATPARGSGGAAPGLRIEAAIGPSIGPCCFEVGPEVAGAFEARFGVEERPVVLRGPAGRARVDLRAAAARILEESGIAAGLVRTSELCTRCGPAYLESYRRAGPDAGRMIALIGRAVSRGNPVRDWG